MRLSHWRILVCTLQAQETLTYLDDHLKQEHNIRDMVDTTLSPPGVSVMTEYLFAALDVQDADLHDIGAKGQIASQYLLKVLLGGVNRKLDKQN